jgi:hypothetical protein
MILAVARNLTTENASLRSGGWQIGVGSDLKGKTLAVLGLGNVGGPVATIGRSFGMRVMAWSPNLTGERAESLGAQLVSKAELFREGDFVTVHLVLSPKTRGIVGESELGVMKPSSYLINTSRGPLIDEGGGAWNSGQLGKIAAILRLWTQIGEAIRSSTKRCAASRYVCSPAELLRAPRQVAASMRPGGGAARVGGDRDDRICRVRPPTVPFLARLVRP